MSNGSSIPGSKPPAAFVKRTQENSASPVDQASFPINTSAYDVAHGKTATPSDRVSTILNRPTSEIVDEASAVVSWAVEESKTVGGLGVNLLTVCALVAASPWSWIAMLFFGPVRVWGFFYAGVLTAAGSAFAYALSVLLFLVVAVIAVLGWVIFRALF